VRRRLLVVGVWLAGAGIAVAVSFAAVARVANGVTPSNVAALSPRAIEHALATPTTRPSPRVALPSTTVSLPPPGVTESTAPPPTPPAPPTSIPPRTSVSAPAPAVTAPPSPPATPKAHDTVTTSRGGTLWTSCSGATAIVYVAAVPKSGYQRTVDVEAPSGIEQQFSNGTHSSQIRASCSDGVVHTEVEEEAGDG